MALANERDILQVLADLQAYVAARSIQTCARCQEPVWMNPGQLVCHPCQRIQQALRATKPAGEDGYLHWNYAQHKWVFIPGGHMPKGPEWGREEEK